MPKRNAFARALGLAASLAAVCAVPWVIDDAYYLEVLILLLINVILVASYRLVTTTGDWSFCHVVLFGVGAYATALLSKFIGLSVWVTIPLAALVTAAVGWAFIFPLLRTVGFGFFIASFAIGELMRQVWIRFNDPFGGPRGMINIPVPELGSIDFFLDAPYYYLTLFVAAASLLIMYRLDRSRIGKLWKAVHMDHVLSECVGIRVPRYRTQAFVIGSFFAGLAGAVLAHRVGAVDPVSFGPTVMVYLIIWVVVGGTGTFWGPIIGVVVMTAVYEASRPLLELRPLIFGGILILTLILMPGGLEGLWAKLRLLGGRLVGHGAPRAPAATSTPASARSRQARWLGLPSIVKGQSNPSSVKKPD